MSTHSTLLGLSILITMFSNSRVDAQKISSSGESAEDERSRICSIFGTVAANAEAIKQGDVLFLERNFYDGFTFNKPLDEGTLDEFRLVRVVFDSDQGLFLVLSRTISEWLVLGDVTPENDGRVIKASDVGLLSDRLAGIIHSKQDNRVAKSIVKTPLPDNIFELFADPRSVGMAGCGLGTLSRCIDSNRVNLTGERLLDWKTENDGFHLRTATTLESTPDSRWVESYVFDHNSNLPIRLERYGELTTAQGGRTIPHFGTFQWKAMSGLHVPSRLTASIFIEYQNPHEKQIDAKKSAQIDFHWFSINEPIPDQLFDDTILIDSKRFQDLIDPRKANATTLIEIIEKLDPKYKLAPGKEPTAPK